MKRERLFRILGLLEQSFIEEAERASSPAAAQRRIPLRRIFAAAACLTLLCGAGIAWLVTGGFQGYGSAETAGAGGSGHEEGSTVFMSYAGPVFPLTALDASSSLTAERTLDWDFGSVSEESGALWGAAVTDSYTLYNQSGKPQTETVLYAFTGSFSDLESCLPELRLDGSKIQAALYAGAYAGGFQGVWAENGLDDSTWNLAQPDSWEDYQALLQDGSYLEHALSPDLDLTQSVVVYEFTNSTGSSDEYPAATQTISFEIDQTQTQIWTYGMNGMEWDNETGWRRYSYFVPNGVRRDWEPHMLIVLGSDITDYALQGYEDGGCEAGEELDTVSCDLIRTETTLEDLLARLTEAQCAQQIDGMAASGSYAFPMALYQRAAAELLCQYGMLAETAVDRYADGRLDEILSEALIQERVFYLAAEITIPAGGSVALEAELWKQPNFDYICSGSENIGIQGYDAVTQLDSNLKFTAQYAQISNSDSIEIVRQNFGFDPENNILKVMLNPEIAHYYLEIREK